MTTTLGSDYVTVKEAADLLDVHPSTIRRWIGRGDLPAYRLGHRRVVLDRVDLNRMVTPTSTKMVSVNGTDVEIPDIPPLTREEQERALALLEHLRRKQAELLAERGGEPFSPSWELLQEVREERSRHLS